MLNTKVQYIRLYPGINGSRVCKVQYIGHSGVNGSMVFNVYYIGHHGVKGSRLCKAQYISHPGINGSGVCEMSDIISITVVWYVMCIYRSSQG